MTPAARHAAAIEILDRVLDGTPAESALTGWARASRFAGSKDRAAVRDIVFDGLRKRRSAACMGGAETGRGIVLGLLRMNASDPDSVFTGAGHAPSPLSAVERASGHPPEGAAALDVPDWTLPLFQETLGDDAAAALSQMRGRSPVWLRVNLLRGDQRAAQAALAADDIVTAPDPNIKTALQVTENARKIRNSTAYLSGLVELQDLSSQRLISALPVDTGLRVLDFCAGGGGKALGLAARGALVTAHDADPGRMADLPARAARAGARIATLQTDQLVAQRPFDMVLVDAPCSGSGTWARSPDAKWRLTPERLDHLCKVQAGILGQMADLVRPGGILAYATCSLFAAENGVCADTVTSELPTFSELSRRQISPLEGGDGFFYAIFRKDD